MVTSRALAGWSRPAQVEPGRVRCTYPERVGSLNGWLRVLQRDEQVSAADLAAMFSLASSDKPWDRTTLFHATASAFVLHPPTGSVLLRWHAGQQAWLQLGGHAEADESDPHRIARREASEESGLCDLVPWPDPDRHEVLHAVVVHVSSTSSQPAHRHADLRYVFATSSPHRVVAEHPDAALRWMSIERAIEHTTELNVRTSLRLLRGSLARATPT